MGRLNDFFILVKSLTGVNMILEHQDIPRPVMPFGTYQSLEEQRDTLGTIKSKVINKGLEIEETQVKRIKELVKLEFHEVDDLKCKQLASKLVDDITFKYQREIEEAGFFIERVDSIKDSTELINSKYKHKRTVVLTIAYTVELKRGIKNMQGVSFKNDIENKQEKVKREA